MKSRLLDMVTQVPFAASASLPQPPVGAALTLRFPGSSAGKESACNAGDPGSTPGSGRSSGDGIGYPLQYSWTSLVVQMVKNPPTMWETWVQSLSGNIPWRRAWQPTLVFLLGESPWTEEPGGLQSMGSQSWTLLSTQYNSLRAPSHCWELLSFTALPSQGWATWVPDILLVGLCLHCVGADFSEIKWEIHSQVL